MRTEALKDEGLYWVEEPTSRDDYEGHAQIRSRTKIPIQMGENWWGPHEWRSASAPAARTSACPTR